MLSTKLLRGRRLAPLRLLRVATHLMLLLVLSCSTETRPLTQLILVADTDMAELDSVEFHIVNQAGDTRSAAGPIAPGAPAFLSMVKGDDAPLGPYQVEVRGLSQGQLVISRQAQLSFVLKSTRTALLHLVRACEMMQCPSEQVCALGQCREPELAQVELVPWPGSPPRLDGSLTQDGGTLDGGTLDSGMLDGGADGDAGDDAGAPDGSGGCAQVTCQGELLEVCSNGVVTGTMACPAGRDPCTRNACVPGKGCAPVPAQNGAACGTGLTCANGVCGQGQQCSAKCSPACAPGVLACDLNCSSAGADCTPTCPKDSHCHLDCAAASNCTGICAGECEVACGESSNCAITCQGGSSCDIDCTGESNCDKVKCQREASCVLRCGDGNNCKFERCDGATIVDCGDGIFTCNAECPTSSDS